MDHIHDSRRIFTDGRQWPKEIEPSFAGYSIGREAYVGRIGALTAFALILDVGLKNHSIFGS
jgi:hypothetical protein